MKNFFISLILLFGVTLFVPQIALGVSDWQQKRFNRMELSCISKKKEQLPENYTGPNLKLIEVSKTRVADTVVSIKVTANGERIFTPIERGNVNCAWSENGYYVDVQEPYSVQIIKKLGKVCDCKEYVEVFGSKGYEVTDVPIGSYLKYIPETQEMQVLPDTEESRKEILERQREQQQIINKRRAEEEKLERKQKEIRNKIDKRYEEIKKIMQEKGLGRLQAQMIVDKKMAQKVLIKDIINIVLTVLGFIIIIGIFWYFAKNIFKKIKKQ